MSDANKQLAKLANGAELGVVGEDSGLPVVRLDADLNVVGRRLGEIVARLDFFEMNGEQVFFDIDGNMQPMTARKFCTWINDHVIIAVKFGKDDGEPVAGMLAIDAASVVLCCENFRRGVRKLAGVNHVRLPVVREGGVLDRLPWGYDEETRIYTVQGGLDYDTGVDLAAAKVGLERIFGGFPFSDDRSRAVQVAMMLSLFCKHLPGGNSLRPGGLWLANKPESGKSVLAKLCLYPVIGSAAGAKMKKDADLDKELEAFVRAAVPYIFLDNVYGGIQSASIDQMLTSEESTGRAMGGHGLFTARNTALLLVTGNRLELNDDAARRFLVVDLFEKGDPAERGVSPENVLNDKRMKAPEFRAKVLGYLWAIVENWAEAGMPRGTVTLGSFEEYSWMLGGVVEAAGYLPPFTKAEIPDAISPEKQEVVELCRMVLAEMGLEDSKDFTLEDFARLARAGQLFQKHVGTQAEGVKLTVKEDGLGKDERAYAEDHGYLTVSQRASWSKRIKKEFGGEVKVDGKKLEFGKREQARKAVFTVSVVK
jgi:hypothetical protein